MYPVEQLDRYSFNVYIQQHILFDDRQSQRADDENRSESSSLMTLWWIIYNDGLFHIFQADIIDLHEPIYSVTQSMMHLRVLHTSTLISSI